MTTESTAYVDLHYSAYRPVRGFVFLSTSYNSQIRPVGRYNRQRRSFSNDNRDFQLETNVEHSWVGFEIRSCDRQIAYAVGYDDVAAYYNSLHATVQSQKPERGLSRLLWNIVDSILTKACRFARIPSRHNPSSGSPKLSGSELVAGSVVSSWLGPESRVSIVSRQSRTRQIGLA